MSTFLRSFIVFLSVESFFKLLFFKISTLGTSIWRHFKWEHKDLQRRSVPHFQPLPNPISKWKFPIKCNTEKTRALPEVLNREITSNYRVKWTQEGSRGWLGRGEERGRSWSPEPLQDWHWHFPKAGSKIPDLNTVKNWMPALQIAQETPIV